MEVQHSHLRLGDASFLHSAVTDGLLPPALSEKDSCHIRFDLRRSFPLFIRETAFWQDVVKELLLSISGSTNAKVMLEKGSNVLDVNFGKNCIDSTALAHRDGDLGPNNGFQWRHFGAKYADTHTDYTGKGVDQLEDVIDKIKSNPNDRRIILSAWNPCDLHQRALLPYELISQFYVAKGELSCQMYQCSADHGIPFSIASYALLTCMIAQVCGLVPGDFILVIGDPRNYATHLRPLFEQLNKQPESFPILKINLEKKDINSFVLSDFKLVDSGDMRDRQSLFIYKIAYEEHGEYAYLKHVKNLILNGNIKDDRTKTGTHSNFSCEMHFNLRKSFPLLTTKRVFWRGVVEELLWFISGSTNAKVLQEKGVHIWDGNASRDYLDSVGLAHREEGDLGPIYGFQWRHFGAEYVDMHTDYTGKGFDQLAYAIDNLKTNPNDKWSILCAWNPSDLPKMALPPCHMLSQFFVENGELSCHMLQRSADMGLGVPFNIASYSLLTCMIAQVCDLVPGDFIYSIGDAHVYVNHIKPLQEQLKKEPKPFPILRINPEKQDIDSFDASDFTLIGYRPHEKIQMKMAV